MRVETLFLRHARFRRRTKHEVRRNISIQVAYHAKQLRPFDADEVHAGFVCDGLRKQRFAASWRTAKQNALRTVGDG